MIHNRCCMKNKKFNKIRYSLEYLLIILFTYPTQKKYQIDKLKEKYK